MTKKLSNAQAKGYQLWYEFSVMRRQLSDSTYEGWIFHFLGIFFLKEFMKKRNHSSNGS